MDRLEIVQLGTVGLSMALLGAEALHASHAIRLALIGLLLANSAVGFALWKNKKA